MSERQKESCGEDKQEGESGRAVGCYVMGIESCHQPLYQTAM